MCGFFIAIDEFPMKDTLCTCILYEPEWSERFGVRYAEVDMNGAKTNRCNRATEEMAPFANKESSMKKILLFIKKDNGDF